MGYLKYGLLAAALLFAGAVIGLWGSAADLNQPIDFKSAVLRGTPNQYLMCPKDYCKDRPHAVSPVFQTSRLKLIEAFENVITSAPKVTKLTHNRDANIRNYEQRSKLVGFPDRITVEYIALDTESSTVAIYSRSKYGYSDRNVNRKRIERWLVRLKERLS